MKPCGCGGWIISGGDAEQYICPDHEVRCPDCGREEEEE